MSRNGELDGDSTRSFGHTNEIKDDLKAMAAEMIYGTGIRLPAEFFLSSDQEANSDFVARLRKRMNDINPSPVTRHGTKRTFIFKELSSSPYVFLRHDATKELTTLRRTV